MPDLHFPTFVVHRQIDTDRLFHLTSDPRGILIHIVHQLHLVPAPLEGIERGHDQSHHTLAHHQEDEEYGPVLGEIPVEEEGVPAIVVTVVMKNEVPVAAVIEATEDDEYLGKIRP